MRSSKSALANYGMHLGTAFQLIDDVLDYSGDNTATGKNVGDDLAEGKPTLPLIYAMQARQCGRSRADPESHRARADSTSFEQVLAAIQRSGALDYTRRQAEAEARAAGAALAILPGSTTANLCYNWRTLP